MSINSQKEKNKMLSVTSLLDKQNTMDSNTLILVNTFVSW